jgi:hypothetical protein
MRHHLIESLVHIETKLALDRLKLVHQLLLVFWSENLAGQRE